MAIGIDLTSSITRLRSTRVHGSTVFALFRGIASRIRPDRTQGIFRMAADRGTALEYGTALE